VVKARWSLPGLVLYLRYDLPAAVVAALAAEVVKAFNKAGSEIGRKVRTALAWALVVATACAAVLAAIVVVVSAVVLVQSAAVAELLLALAPVLARIGAELPRILEALRRLVERITPVAQEFGLTMTPVRSPADGSLHLVVGSNGADLPTASATAGPLRQDNCPLILLSALDDVVEVAGPLAAAVMMGRPRLPASS
jgi:hypothetical protein